MTRLRIVLLSASPLLLASGCDNSSEQSVDETTTATVWLADQQRESGLVFEHQLLDSDGHQLPDAVGSGVGVLDLDGDGLLDIVLIQGHPGQVAIFHNLGDGQFKAGEVLSLGDAFGMGVATGDYDQDGDLDVYVTALGRNALFRNEGDGRLTDVTDETGVGHTGFGAGASFLDADGDRDFDLMVVNYVDWTPEVERQCRNARGELDYCAPVDYGRPTSDVLYRNDGNGRFVDWSMESGIGQVQGTGLGVLTGDFDGDGLEDIFVANDGMPDRLWRNRGDLSFEEVGLLQGCAVDNTGKAKAGMGVTAADIDFDGDLDLMVCNLQGETDSVFRNDGDHFRDITSTSNLAQLPRRFTRFGLGWVDLDNDGLLDLFQANGRVARYGELYSEDPYAEPDLLLRGTESGRFQAMQIDSPAASGRGTAFADLDNDGGMDVVINNRAGIPQLLMNQHPDRGEWLILDVRNSAGAPAIGATVMVTLGDRAIRRDVRTGWSYLAANDPRIHVGLDKAEVVEDVSVIWADGEITSFGSMKSGMMHLLERNAAEASR
ncbi:MAG: CRTAC1 family protein [Phycisphaerales bacterium]|nr:CRTAC1 family protein [Phycisphaerales bacterium]